MIVLLVELYFLFLIIFGGVVFKRHRDQTITSVGYRILMQLIGHGQKLQRILIFKAEYVT